MDWKDWPTGAERLTNDEDEEPLKPRKFQGDRPGQQGGLGYYLNRKVNGACVTCGVYLPGDWEYVSCRECRDRKGGYAA